MWSNETPYTYNKQVVRGQTKKKRRNVHVYTKVSKNVIKTSNARMM